MIHHGVSYLVQHGNDTATGWEQKEFTGPGSKQRAVSYANSRARAGLVNEEYPIEVFRAVHRKGILKEQKTIGMWFVK